MTKILVLILTCLSSASYGQASKYSFPDEINTTKTAAHINIPRTKVYIVPPKGFKISSSVAAIEKGSSESVMVMDLVGGNFYTNAARFSRKNFEDKGIKVLDYKELKFNALPAKMALVEDNQNSSIYCIVFGDSTFSVMIMGTFAFDDPKQYEEVKGAILSIYYDPNKSIDPFGSASFSLDDSKSIFKFAKFSASMYIYSIGGADKDSYKGEPYLMVTTLPIEGATLRSTADDLSKRISSPIIKNLSEDKVNGYPSLRREVHGTVDGIPAMLYQHVVQVGPTAIVMQGYTESDFEENATEFEKLSNTIQKK